MRSIFKNSIRIVLLLGLAALFLVSTTMAVNADVLKIEPKGKKEIKIAVLDLISAIETAAQTNSHYMKEGKKRGWDVRVFDLKMNYAEAPNILETMINAGYDAILVNWTSPKYYKAQVKKAFDKGIPVFTNHCGDLVPGLAAEFAVSSYAQGAMTADYISTKLKAGDKILMSTDPTVAPCINRRIVAERVFEDRKITIAQKLYFTSGDPVQVGYDQVKNALTADVNKEIKAVWTDWEGRGQSASRAAMDLKRSDIIVATTDDSPLTYTYLRENPTYHATAAMIGKMGILVERMFKELDNVFAGKPLQTETVIIPVSSYLVTKENLPPKGYFFRDDGNYSGKPNFKVQ
jgi:ABC-type sugar transport system substrate-binding protein